MYSATELELGRLHFVAVVDYLLIDNNNFDEFTITEFCWLITGLQIEVDEFGRNWNFPSMIGFTTDIRKSSTVRQYTPSLSIEPIHYKKNLDFLQIELGTYSQTIP